MHKESSQAEVKENGIKRKAFIFHTSKPNPLYLKKKQLHPLMKKKIDHSFSVIHNSKLSKYLKSSVRNSDYKIKSYSQQKQRHYHNIEIVNDFNKCNGDLKQLKNMIRKKKRSSNHYLNNNFNDKLQSVKKTLDKTQDYIKNLNIDERMEVVRTSQVIELDKETSIQLSNKLDYEDSTKFFQLKDEVLSLPKMDIMNTWNNNPSYTMNHYSMIQPDTMNSIQLMFIGKNIDNQVKEMQLIIKQKEEREDYLQKRITLLENDLKHFTDNYTSIQNSLQIAMSEVNKGEELRMQLHSYIQTIRGNLRVFCRVKPRTVFSAQSCLYYPEIFSNHHYDNSITNDDKMIEDNQAVIPLTTLELKDPKSRNNNTSMTYHFDHLFSESSSQSDIFSEIKPFIQSAMDGDDVCIFAYGATGTGKTFTMQGPIYSSFINEFSGILPRTAEFIFNEISRIERFTDNLTIKLSLSAIEIYNEMIYDLFNDSKTKQPLTLSNTQLKNLITYKINNRTEIVQLCEEASKSRRSESTVYNDTSSRSHAVYMLKLQCTGGSKRSFESVINIIDLAGSEKSTMTSFENKSRGEIETMKKIQTEANYINKSLTTLGRVISMLADKKANKALIPYRDSKLTMTLKNSLKPTSKTVLIVTISPNEENITQTKDSLLFASNALMAF